ncbi:MULTISPECIES: glycosyltransferase family 87 protein [unclassified Solwaraspora]|uniref:glycosyltransferase family 87 protein n=1 Tax=unclassified Solwaraspora TaxID=2627926 RepID=UPI00259B667F|nr:glycosyltransferase 87 family protein [Solwaraspora sp. WMMA2056]WJK41774.1 glycosyltransferase 87 family protein [Solwaraspora sp. WMMA2056]
MSVQPPNSIDEAQRDEPVGQPGTGTGVDPDAAPVDYPSRADGFVRGLSEAIGGPLGRHAAGQDVVAARTGRFWTAARVVLALICLSLAAHWVQKSPCMDGGWHSNVQYTRFCYTDVLALYYAEGLNEGKVPYLDHPVEYPVVTGYFMGVLGLPVHALGADRPDLNQAMWFYNANALVLCALAVAAVATILALRRRRPWDAAMFALAPALVLTATVNWDMLPIAFAAFGLYAWARKRPVLAGILLGIGGAAKMWPLFLLGPILVLGLRSARIRATATAIAVAVATVVAVNLPVYLWANDGWRRFFELNSERPIDWGTLWYIGRYLDGKWAAGAPGDQGPFQWLSANIPTLNTLSYVLFGLACVGVGALALLAPRRPRLAALAFLVVAAFLIFSKVWSQQFTLWLLPLIVLARPRWGAFLAWQAAEVGYFFAFYGQLLGATNGSPVIPEGVFVLAATLRLATVVALCVFIIRDILAPERDVVRGNYLDDPDGGVFDGATDAAWISSLRRWFGSGGPGAGARAPSQPEDDRVADVGALDAEPVNR